MIRLGLLLAIFFALPVPNAVGMAQQQQWHIPSSAMIAIVAKPMDALAQPGMEMIPHEILSVMGQRELGFDPCLIVNATVVVEAPESFDGPPPGFAIVLQFDSPQQPGQVVLENLEKGDFGGKTIYRGSHEQEPAILQLDEKTLIFGNEQFFIKMLAESDSGGELNQLMFAQPFKGQIAAWVVIDPVRELIKMNLPPAEQIPGPFQELLELPDMIENFTASADLSGTTNHRFQIGTTDPESAKQVWAIMQRGLFVARSMIMGQLSAEIGPDDQEMQDAFQQYSKRIGKFVEAGIQPDIVGSSLVFEASSSDPTMSVATIGVLTGLLLPAVQQVREAARRTQSMNNLRQLALAMHNYESVYKKFPAAATVSPDGEPLLSWRVQILPYLEQQALYEQFHQDEPWDSPHNIKLLDKMPAVFQNPNLPAGQDTVYLVFTGSNSTYADGNAPRLRDLRDGTSNTLAIVEADQEIAVPWTQPMDIEFDPDNPRAGIQGSRTGGFIAAMFDGSVQFITGIIDDETFRNLVNPNDGNTIRIR